MLNLTSNSTLDEYSDDYVEEESEDTTELESSKSPVIEVFCYIKNPHENVDEHLQKRMDHCNYEGMECLPNWSNSQSESSDQPHNEYYCNRKATATNSLTHYSCRFNYYNKQRKCDNLNECYSAHFNCHEFHIENKIPYFILLGFALSIILLIFLKFICKQYLNHNRSGTYQLNSSTFRNSLKCF